MIRGLARPVEHAHRALRRACGLEQHLPEHVVVQVMAARAGHEDALLLEHRHRESIVFAIRACARRDRTARLDERRRVEHDDAVALALALQTAHGVERIHAQELHAVREPVALDVGARQRQRGFRRIDRQHARGPTARHVHGPLALIAEHVECAAAVRTRLGTLAVLALVQEQTGLLTVDQVGLEREPADRDRDLLGYVTPPDPAVLIQTFELPERGVGDQDGALRLEHLLERDAQRLQLLIHAARQYLHREHVAIAIDHESRQLIGLAIHHSYRVLARVKCLAGALRALETLDEEVGVDLVAAARQHARADQAVAIDVGLAKERAALIQHLDDATVLDRALPLLDLVGEDPRVAAANPAILAASQHEPSGTDGRGHRWLLSMWPIMR